jgi:hypothetical protein
MSDAAAPQLVGYDHPRHLLRNLQQSLEEALCGVGIVLGLNKYVQQDAILIDCAPEIMLHALDADKHLLKMLLVSGSWASGRRYCVKSAGELGVGIILFRTGGAANLTRMSTRLRLRPGSRPISLASRHCMRLAPWQNHASTLPTDTAPRLGFERRCHMLSHRPVESSQRLLNLFAKRL